MPLVPLGVALVGIAARARVAPARSRGARRSHSRHGRRSSRWRCGTTRTPPTTRRCCSRRAPTPTAGSTSPASSSEPGRMRRRVSRLQHPRLGAPDRGRRVLAPTRGRAASGGRRARSPAASARGHRGDAAARGSRARARGAPHALAARVARGRSRPDAGGHAVPEGASVVREDEAVVGPGAVEMLVRAPVLRELARRHARRRGRLRRISRAGRRSRCGRRARSSSCRSPRTMRCAAGTGARSSRAAICGSSRKRCCGPHANGTGGAEVR